MHCLLTATILFAATPLFFTCVTCNRASPPQKVIRLALAASRASYMPWILQGNLYPFGYIKENAGTVPQLPTMLMGTLADSMPKPNVFSVLPPSIYNMLLDKSPCSIAWWNALTYAKKGSQAIMLRNNAHKIVVFGFRGMKAYSLNYIQQNFIAKPRWIKVGGKSFWVHKPFLQRYKHVERWFEQHYKKVPKDFTIIVTGYDLGGSQAYIAALLITLKTTRRPDAVVTFGAPPVGGLVFNNLYGIKVGCTRTVSITVLLDVFTRFPVGAIRPCSDTPVNGGKRKKDIITDELQKMFIKNFPTVMPQIISFLLPPDVNKVVSKFLPAKRQEEIFKNLTSSAQNAFNIIRDFQDSHDLYHGYANGIKVAYKGQTIDYGCNKPL